MAGTLVRSVVCGVELAKIGELVSVSQTRSDVIFVTLSFACPFEEMFQFPKKTVATKAVLAETSSS